MSLAKPTGVRNLGHALLLATMLLAACDREPTIAADIAMTIDGEEIRYERFDDYLRRNVEADLPLDGDVRSRLFDRYLDEQLLIRLAVDSGMTFPDPPPLQAPPAARGPGPRDPLAAVDQRQAIGFLLRGHPPREWSEAELAAFYEAHRERYERHEEVHLRQILVDDRERAEEARRALARGEDFARVAARLSQEPKAQLGGDQGRLAREDLPPAFADVIFGLEPGEVTDVIAADYGFHLFQVLERYPAEALTLAQVAGEIRRILERRHVDELVAGFIEEARGRYNVEVYLTNLPFDYRGFYANRDKTRSSSG